MLFGEAIREHGGEQQLAWQRQCSALRSCWGASKGEDPKLGFPNAQLPKGPFIRVVCHTQTVWSRAFLLVSAGLDPMQPRLAVSSQTQYTTGALDVRVHHSQMITV